MYSLEEKKAIPFKEKLQNGEIFLKYERKSDKVLYLANLTKKRVAAKPAQAQQAKTLSILKSSKESSTDCESLIKLKLDEDVKQQAKPENKIRLNFQGVDCEFGDARKGVILDAHIHNKN